MITLCWSVKPRWVRSGRLKKNLESEQAERAKDESCLKSSLEYFEKVKANFDAERSALESEKATLLKRAEDAENNLSRWLQNWPT